jgi:hypothetical protein
MVGPTNPPTKLGRGKPAPEEEIMLPQTTSTSILPFKFRIIRSFKALDDGQRKKWIIIAAAEDLPPNLPLDANARLPNVIKNKTCKELRQTLLQSPELFQILNSGIVCTASHINVVQDGKEHFIEVGFAQETEGIVNGGHTYATLLHLLRGDTTYSEGKDLRVVLEKDGAGSNDSFYETVSDEDELIKRLAQARKTAQVQIEVVAPIKESELLAQIGRARNLSQSVEATSLQNLAGKFNLMKEVLRTAKKPFGVDFEKRVVWKTNEEVPEESKSIPVKILIQLLSLMNSRRYAPEIRVPTDVYSRVGFIIREFGESEGAEEEFHKKLTKLLPQLITFYDHIYATLSEVDPDFPWADGKPDAEKKRRRTATTPFLENSCGSRVSNAFIWPIFAAFRILLTEQEDGTLTFKADPFVLFDDMKISLVSAVKSFHQNQAHGLVHQVGKDKEIWVRLQGILETELKIRERLAAVTK